MDGLELIPIRLLSLIASDLAWAISAETAWEEATSLAYALMSHAVRLKNYNEKSANIGISYLTGDPD